MSELGDERKNALLIGFDFVRRFGDHKRERYDSGGYGGGAGGYGGRGGGGDRERERERERDRGDHRRMDKSR